MRTHIAICLVALGADSLRRANSVIFALTRRFQYAIFLSRHDSAPDPQDIAQLAELAEFADYETYSDLADAYDDIARRPPRFHQPSATPICKPPNPNLE